MTAAGTSVAVSTAAGDLVLDMVSSTTALTAVGAGQTAQVNNVDDYYGASSELATGASTTMSWTAAAGFSGIAAVPYKEATGGGGAVRRRRVTLRAPKNTQRAFKPMSRLLMGATQIVGALPAPPGLEPIGGDATIDITRIKRHRTAMKGGR